MVWALIVRMLYIFFDKREIKSSSSYNGSNIYMTCIKHDSHIIEALLLVKSGLLCKGQDFCCCAKDIQANTFLMTSFKCHDYVCLTIEALIANVEGIS